MTDHALIARLPLSACSGGQVAKGGMRASLCLYSQDEVKEIADIMLRDVFSRTEEKGIELTVTDAFKDRLVEEGFDPSYGARPLRRAIMRLVEDYISDAMLKEELKEGDAAQMDVDPQGDVICTALGSSKAKSGDDEDDVEASMVTVQDV